MRAATYLGVKFLPSALRPEPDAASRKQALPLRQVYRDSSDNLRAARSSRGRIGMRSAHSTFTIDTDGRGRIFRRSSGLQLVSRPPAIRTLLVEDALGYDALVDDKRMRRVVDRLNSLPDAKFPLALHSFYPCPSFDGPAQTLLVVLTMALRAVARRLATPQPVVPLQGDETRIISGDKRHARQSAAGWRSPMYAYFCLPFPASPAFSRFFNTTRLRLLAYFLGFPSFPTFSYFFDSSHTFYVFLRFSLIPIRNLRDAILGCDKGSFALTLNACFCLFLDLDAVSCHVRTVCIHSGP